MDELREAFVGIDVAKLRNAVAVADGGRMGEVRYLVADSDHRAQAFRFDAAQRSDLIARS
ncbi:hypothetical protein GCM10017612_06060 [Novosphingobium resinovorum]|nr:hypothetical protein GCM10017612_06060 [Novosphingobium resinovorum]